MKENTAEETFNGLLKQKRSVRSPDLPKSLCCEHYFRMVKSVKTAESGCSRGFCGVETKLNSEDLLSS